MKINAEWHAKHRMPKNPTIEKRMKWHLDHARHCACRPMPADIREEAKKKYLNTHQEFWVFFTKQDHKDLASWAAACAEHVLPYFEKGHGEDTRPREAITVLKEWIETDIFTMSVIRKVSLNAHAAARSVEEKDRPAFFAARAAGQAVATAHVPTHAIGPVLYGLKAVAAAHPNDKDVVGKEEAWQLDRVPKKLKKWVMKEIESKRSAFKV